MIQKTNRKWLCIYKQIWYSAFAKESAVPTVERNVVSEHLY